MEGKARIDPPLPRTSYFLRSIGFQLPSLVTLGSRKKPTAEPIKPVIRTSLATAFAHCGVHIIPCLASITLISLNLAHLYLGRDISGPIENVPVAIALLQIAAKVQEMLIVASLAALVFQVVRYEMIVGEGVPLGFLGSGFLFSQLSFFWSPEFWGAFGARTPLLAKVRLVAFLLVSGLIAATAGPACATLLIPRDQDFNAGGSAFYLRGLADELWPSNMTFTPNESNSLCDGSNAINYAFCPSGGYYSLWSYVMNMPMIWNPIGFQHNTTTYLQFGTKSTKLPSTFRLVPGSDFQGNYRCLACQTSLSGPYIPAAILQRQLELDWMDGVIAIPSDASTNPALEFKYYGNRQSRTPLRVPAVRVACSEAQNLSNVEQIINFPIMPEYNCWYDTRAFKVLHLNNTRCDHLRITWTTLPLDFGNVSTGLVFEAPWTTSNTSRVVIGCAVDARWTSGIMTTSVTTADGSESHAWIDTLSDAAPFDGSTFWSSDAWQTYSEFRPTPNSSWYQITLDQSWLDVLTPSTPIQGPGYYSWNPSTIESILTNSALIDGLFSQWTDPVKIWNGMEEGGANRTVYLEWIISMLVTDGISRQGSINVLNTSGPITNWAILDYNKSVDFQNQLLKGGKALNPPKTANITSLISSIVIGGFSYKSSTATDYLAMGVLIAHMLLALIHILRLLLSCQSYTCWDSITELLVLMQNSRPAPVALKNTCAGINRLGTFSKVAKVRAIKYSIAGGSEDNDEDNIVRHVELLFSEEQEASLELEGLLSDPSYQTIRSQRTTSEHVDAVSLSSATSGQHSSCSSQLERWEVDGQSSVLYNRKRITSRASLEIIQPDQLYGS